MTPLHAIMWTVGSMEKRKNRKLINWKLKRTRKRTADTETDGGHGRRKWKYPSNYHIVQPLLVPLPRVLHWHLRRVTSPTAYADHGYIVRYIDTGAQHCNYVIIAWVFPFPPSVSVSVSVFSFLFFHAPEQSPAWRNTETVGVFELQFLSLLSLVFVLLRTV